MVRRERMPRTGGHYPKASGQQEVQTSIQPTVSDRPPKPVQRPRRDKQVNEQPGRVVMLEEALVACWQLYNDQVLNRTYREYLAECTAEMVEEILERRPDLLRQPPTDPRDQEGLRP